MTTVLPPALRLVFWETTAACNLHCGHCRRVDALDQADPEELDHEEALGLVDQIATCGRPILVFSGGEPLVRPDIFDLIARARSHQLPVALATNGTLVDPALASRITAAGVQRVSVSLDGADAATHDDLRALPGSFDQAVAGLLHLNQAGVSTQVNSTVTTRNHHQLDRLYDTCLALGADALHLFVLVPTGCGAGLDGRLGPGQQEQVLRWLHQRNEQGPLFCKATCAPQYHRIMRQRAAAAGTVPEIRSHGMAAQTKGCLAGSGVCFISHRGQVQPCDYMPEAAGNIRQQSLSEIWQDSLLFETLRDPDQLQGRCGACEYRSDCGGCRARALAESGNMLGEEPGCAYQPKVGGTVRTGALVN